MPAPLVKAHKNLDRAVDLCYRSQPFPHQRSRLEFLFHLYQTLSAPLLKDASPRRSRRPK